MLRSDKCLFKDAKLILGKPSNYVGEVVSPLTLTYIKLVDTRSGKRLYRKRTVVNVAFTGSIPGIVISTGNAKWIN